MKVKIESESCSIVSDSLRPHGLHSTWNFPGQNTGVGSLSFLQEIFPTQGLNPGLPALHTDSLPAKPQGKPKNPGVGNLSFLQGIFPTQESNQDLLNCRWILYQLSYEGSPTNHQPRQHIKKQRHYFANKGPSSQSYGFSSSHVWM